MSKKIFPSVLIICLIAIGIVFSGSSCGDKPLGVKAPASTTNTENPNTPNTPGTFTLTSTSFTNGGTIPNRIAKERGTSNNGASPQVSWTNVPEGTKSFAFVMRDQDKDPNYGDIINWMVIDIPSKESSLVEGASGKNMPAGAKEMDSSYSNNSYYGPNPDDGKVHTYVLTLYALSIASLELATNAKFETFTTVINGKTLGTAAITGKFGYDQTTQISLATDVQPIFTSRCVGCHPSAGDLDLSSVNSYANLVNVNSKKDSSMMRVKPSDSANSVLYLKVSGTTKGDQMPTTGDLLSTDDQNKIKNWIDQGAKNN